MKYLLILVLFCGISQLSFAEGKGPQMAEFWVESNQMDSTVPANVARVTLNVPYMNAQKHSGLLYGYNGTSFSAEFDENNQVIFDLAPGTYIFQFYPKNGSEYREIETAAIEVTGGFNMIMRLNFRSSTPRNNRVKKPVIYLYPEEKTDVTLELIPKGDLTFTYPAYDNGWNFTAEPNGNLTIDNNSYNYLFWEADQPNLEDLVDATEGFIVQGNEVTAFLEKQLNIFGFTGKERADFITFWAPQMVTHKEVFIHFKMNQECAVFADLEITPTPDEISRFYMLWDQVPENFQRNNIKKQEIPAMRRKGFTVLEWGGAEVDLSSNVRTLQSRVELTLKK